MYLTDYEKELLDGTHGDAMQLAMGVLYDLGKHYGVEHFVEISACHDDSTVYLGEAQVAFAEHLVELGARFCVPTTTNACALDMKRFARQKHDVGLMTATRRIEAAHLALGAIASWTCAPYQAGFSPAFGQQVACAESNVIAFVNSIVGARTNRYAGPLELLAGITGRVPYFGLHVTENRKARGLITLGDDITPDMFEFDDFYTLAAYAYGDIVGDRVWAMDGLPPYISMDNLKNMSATMASSGGIALFHLVGITPEAQTLEMAFQGEQPKEVVTLTRKSIENAETQLCNGDTGCDLDLVTLGCPHFSCAEFLQLEQALGGRKVHANTLLWVFTGRTTRAMLKDSGQLHRLSNLGVEVFVDGCCLQHPTQKWGTKTFMSNSGKFGTYCFGLTESHPFLGTIFECAESAVQGKVIREKKPWWN
ncbi:predicted aconitase subunit 1 [Desulfocicer vacuolatum DSM 3385]|uniref:Predicted aconitase subunit 1 n=1 Tax=Desulfocicer vacuolatum DSM 3385 TaxID=1121400 RepID=A0A1W2AUA4_9BACT|nr:aconitase X catalytic domain-containing protein [Desulfocicer vacuolatum]SMC64275.1 predicted aconitase subunit 1 [Desulfocicer vacuolatum DSM 3385]